MNKPLIPGTVIYPPKVFTLEEAYETADMLNAQEQELCNVDPEAGEPWKYTVEEIGKGNALLKAYDEEGHLAGYF